MLDEDRHLAETFGAPRAIALNLWSGAMLASPIHAIPLLEQAEDLLRSCRANVDRARVLSDLGGAIRRDGRSVEARPVLRQAVALARQVGAVAVASTASDELHLAGGRLSAEQTTASDPLTPGERRVVELARQGRTNRQIANALYITIKAVEWHLGNAYRKLGIRSRAELT